MRKFRVKLEWKVDHIILVSVKYLYWLSCSNLSLTSQKDPSYVAIHVSSDGTDFKFTSLGVLKGIEILNEPFIFYQFEIVLPFIKKG